MPKARLVFDGDNLYTEKDARIYKLKQEISTKIDAIPGVVDDLNSTSSTDALSANMGRELQDQINALKGNFHFLSSWDCTTGLPGTDPVDDPYTYESGDYYIVGNVGGTGETNYKPHGSSYTHGVPSTAVETGTVNLNDWYIFDGADWVLQPAGSQTIVIDSQMDSTSRNPVENRVITQALAGKQNTISDLSTIRSGATAGATALQPSANITQLTNNAGYQTAGEVNSAIQTAIAGIDASNTKTFFLSGTSDLTNAQAAYDWIESGKNAIINHSGVSYILSSSGAHSMGFDSTSKTYSMSPTDGYVVPKVKHMRFFLNNGVVTQISIQGENWHGYIPVSGILGDGFTPTANAHPATKKYVDDNDTKIASVAPSNPTEGMLWYDTTNHSLKVYDNNQWNAVGGGGGTTYTAGNNIDITNDVISAINIIRTDDTNEYGFTIGDYSGASSGVGATMDTMSIDVHDSIGDGGGMHDYNTSMTTEGITITSLHDESHEEPDPEREPDPENPEDVPPMIPINTSDDYTTYIRPSGITLDRYYTDGYDTTIEYTEAYSFEQGDNNQIARKKDIDGKITSGSTAPSNPTEGMLWYDTTNDVLKVYDGTQWNEVGSGGVGDMTKSVYDPNNVEADVYDYNNFIHTPTIGIGLLTLQKNGTQVAQFNANSTANVTANITVPTTVAELSDASDYVTDSELTADLADYVEGPSTAVNGNIAVFDGTTGKLIADSGLKIQVTASRPSGLYCDVYYNNGTIYLFTGGVEPNNLSSESGDNLITEGGDNIILEY